MAGWRFVTAVPDGVPLSIGELNPWEQKWRRVEGLVAEVRDPAYNRRFGMSMHEIGDSDRPVRFAAGEFSNTIWGFYVPD